MLVFSSAFLERSNHMPLNSCVCCFLHSLSWSLSPRCSTTILLLFLSCCFKTEVPQTVFSEHLCLATSPKYRLILNSLFDQYDYSDNFLDSRQTERTSELTVSNTTVLHRQTDQTASSLNAADKAMHSVQCSLGLHTCTRYLICNVTDDVSHAHTLQYVHHDIVLHYPSSRLLPPGRHPATTTCI